MSRKNKREGVWEIRFRDNGTIKTGTVTTFDNKMAKRLAKSYPNVISVRKRFYDRIIYHEVNEVVKHVEAEQQKVSTNPLAMDEFLWMRRQKRIKNRVKDKNYT